MNKVAWLTTSTINTEPIIGSLESLELPIETHIVKFDALEQGNFNELAIEQIKEIKPDLVLYNSVSGGAFLPRTDTFKRIREISKLVHICFDASCPNWHELLHSYNKEDAFDVTVNIDGNDNWPKTERDLTTLCPIDVRPYKKRTDKLIHCGFAGGDGSAQRRQILEFLKSNNAIVTKSHDETPNKYDEYAEFVKQCKIIVNMALCGSGLALQVKARVIESGLAGCCLLEEQGAATSRWFIPGRDYLEYESKEDLLSKIRFLTPVETQGYASKLQKKVMTEHSPKVFWSKVFKAISFSSLS